MEDFFTDLRIYGKNKKWMLFELFVRQPLSLCGFAVYNTQLTHPTNREVNI